MAITPLPQPLPTNLATIKDLIDERKTEIASLEETIDASQLSIAGYKEEMVRLQNVAKVLLNMNPKEPKEPKPADGKNPITGEPL